MSVKLERLGNIFLEAISNVIQTEVHDDNIDEFLSITYVKVDSDLSLAKIYFTVLDSSKKELTLETLNKASNFIRSKLFDLVVVRKMPELRFVYDESVEYGRKIEDIIEKNNK